MTGLSLPHSVEAERAVLGACLVRPENIAKAAEVVSPDDFYLQSHRLLFRGMVEMDRKGQAVDLLTLQAVTACMEPGDMSRLMDGIPRLVNVTHYAAIVAERAIGRRLVEFAVRISDEAAASSDPRSVAQAGLDSLAVIANHGQSSSWAKLDAVLGTALDDIERRASSGMKLGGVTSGFPDIDTMTDGWHAGELITLAAVPSMGKTALGMAFAIGAAKAGVRTAVFSLEMSNAQLGLRVGFAEANVEAKRARTEGLSDHEWGRVASAFGRLQGLPLFLDESAGITVNDMVNRVKRLSRERGQIGLIVVDYLGLVSPGRKFENRTQEVGSISTGLKTMAKTLNVPVIALAQLNREVAKEKERKPQLHHLRDSGRVVEDSDVVLLLHREGYYLEREGKAVSDEQRTGAELFVAKQRNGPIGLVNLVFDSRKTSFKSAIRASAEANDAFTHKRKDLE